MQLDPKWLDPATYRSGIREPNFADFLRVLSGEAPTRATLFEFFLNEPLYLSVCDPRVAAKKDAYTASRIAMDAYARLGYDCVNLHGSNFGFPVAEVKKGATYSANDTAVITDRASYLDYPWQEPEDCDYSCLEVLGREMPHGMKLVVCGPGGVLENVIALVGYENMCYMSVDEPELLEDIFAQVGERLVRYYRVCGQFDAVGAMISNDDWGFNTQTMLSPADMRRYVFPWHQRIVEAIRESGRPAILHSCGQLKDVYGDVIRLGYAAKHSYEDVIEPVEQAYEHLHGSLAVLGGIDLNFVCRATPEAIFRRSLAMLERTAERGGYALGTGNSVPTYVPVENYLAMIAAVHAVGS